MTGGLILACSAIGIGPGAWRVLLYRAEPVVIIGIDAVKITIAETWRGFGQFFVGHETIIVPISHQTHGID